MCKHVLLHESCLSSRTVRKVKGTKSFNLKALQKVTYWPVCLSTIETSFSIQQVIVYVTYPDIYTKFIPSKI